MLEMASDPMHTHRPHLARPHPAPLPLPAPTPPAHPTVPAHALPARPQPAHSVLAPAKSPDPTYLVQREGHHQEQRLQLLVGIIHLCDRKHRRYLQSTQATFMLAMSSTLRRMNANNKIP